MLALLMTIVLFDFDNGRSVRVMPEEQMVVKLITPAGESRWQIVLSSGLEKLSEYREPCRSGFEYQVFVFRAMGPGQLGVEYRGLTRYVPPSRSFWVRVNSI